MCDFFSFFFVDVFKMDPDFQENEEKYKTLKRGTLPPLDFECPPRANSIPPPLARIAPQTQPQPFESATAPAELRGVN